MLSRRMKRDLSAEEGDGLRKRWEPTYERIQNGTCVLTPEGMEGVSLFSLSQKTEEVGSCRNEH